MNFSESGLKPTILRALEKMGYEQATPIQQQTLTLFPQGKHILWQSQTGTWKTAAFVLPLLNAVDPQDKRVQAVILVPTRELAMQTQEECYELGKFSRVRALAAYGGRSIFFQKKLLDQGMQIAVCTPGRCIDLIKRWMMPVDAVKYFVLDEVDRMLDMGFLDDVQRIWDQMPALQQVMCFSATLPKPLVQLVNSRLGNDYAHIEIQKEIIVDKIDHMFVDAPHISKRSMLDHWLASHAWKKVIIFAQTKKLTRDLRKYLQSQWYSAGELHGDIDQRDRTRTLKAYKEDHIQILVATDVASRGLNMNDIDLVINFDVPQDPEDYVHRIGRTARAGKTGQAVTFVDDDEYRSLHAIEKIQKTRIKKVDKAGDEVARTDRPSTGRSRGGKRWYTRGWHGNKWRGRPAGRSWGSRWPNRWASRSHGRSSGKPASWSRHQSRSGAWSASRSHRKPGSKSRARFGGVRS